LNLGRVVTLVSSMPFKCPAAPYEAAMLLESDFRKRRLRDRVSFSVYTPEPGPLPVTGQANSDMVRKMIERKGIEYFPGHAVTKVDNKSSTIEFANGVKAEFDLLAYVPPHRATAVVHEAGLTGESGWVPVDKHKFTTKFPKVYAIGDITGIPLPVGKPLPKAGVFAHGQAEVVAGNIINEILGKGREKTFNGHGACYLEIGDGLAGMGTGNFYADPAPAVKLRWPSPLHHLGKIIFEKYWLYRWF
jgi:sulfide:quinone oxidoreductase